MQRTETVHHQQQQHHQYQHEHQQSWNHQPQSMYLLAELELLSAREFHERYAEVFGEVARSHNRLWLHRRVAWRMQMLAEGELAERTIDSVCEKAAVLARDADLRVRPLAGPMESNVPDRTITVGLPTGRDERVPPPGGVLVRVFKAGSIG